jgi:hypothetical protein
LETEEDIPDGTLCVDCGMCGKRCDMTKVEYFAIHGAVCPECLKKLGYIDEEGQRRA